MTALRLYNTGYGLLYSDMVMCLGLALRISQIARDGNITFDGLVQHIGAELASLGEGDTFGEQVKLCDLMGYTPIAEAGYAVAHTVLGMRRHGLMLGHV